MNVNEIISEAPVGLVKQVGRKIGAKALGAVGAKATAAGLSGAAETGDVARQLNVALKKYAGQTGTNMKQLDAQDLAAFLKSKGFPTTPLAGVSGILAPKQIDQVLLKAAQEKAKVRGTKPAAGISTASGKPAQGSVLDKIQQKTGMKGVGGKTTAPAASAVNPAVAKQIAAVKAKIQKLNAKQKQELVGMI